MSFWQKSLLSMAVLTVAVSGYAMNSISFFTGNNYAGGNTKASSLEFLYGGDWKYGDNLFFFDVTNPHKNVTAIDGEWSTRFSYNKITHKNLKLGPLSDVLGAAAMDVTGTNQRAFGLGLGTDWTVPHFTKVSVNAYWVHNDAVKGTSYEIAGLWALPLMVNDRIHLLFSGLAEYMGPTIGTIGLKRLKANYMIKPAVMLDLGNALNMSSNRLYMGVQYSYWHNMLGLSETESTPELKISWVL